MIEIRYKGILLLQTFFLSALGTFTYHYFKSTFHLHTTPTFLRNYILIWIGFMALSHLFLKFFVLPSKRLINNLHSKTSTDDISWAIVEDTLDKKNLDLQNQKIEFEQENLKYKTLLDSLHDPVCIFNQDEKLIYSNYSYNSLFSLPEDIHSAPLIEITRNHDFQNFIKAGLATSGPVKLKDFTFSPGQDLGRTFYDITIFPLDNHQINLCIMHDVTERKITDQLREDFVSNFSHEIRTPLTILSGQMQSLKMKLLKENSLDQSHTAIFEKIDNNSRRLVALFNDLLQLTSIEKKKDLLKENIELTPLIEPLTEELINNYPKKMITASFDFKEPTLFVDYGLFEQVMINLIDNALKYSSDSGTIELKSYTESQQDQILSVLEIRDNGIGIPEDQLHRIFERFFRIDSSRSSNVEGSGLGLSIVKHIIQKHDGKIKVSSIIDKGTCFSLYFPKKIS